MLVQDGVGAAVHAALVYADIFDFPLRPAEAHRFLPRRVASLPEVEAALAAWPARAGLHHLPGREHLVEQRLARDREADRLWAQALRYGRLLWSLPFVEMVGITGSVAVRNTQPTDDVDFMLVAAVGRLWTVRALAIGVVRIAQARGVGLCPNYLVTERALALRQRDLFTAHELLQLVPLAGMAAYDRLIAANAWAFDLLPNARPYAAPLLGAGVPASRRGLQRCLAGRVGDRLEAWEAGRKIPRFSARAGRAAEIVFTPDECKGHFEQHGRRILDTYAARMLALEAVPR